MLTSKKSIFTFNGRVSSDWNFYKTSPINFPSPVRDVESKPIPGRNGNLLLDNGRYANVEITIECWIKSDFRKYYDQFRGFLMQDSDYHRLEDDQYPDEFRMARVVKVETNLISPAAGSIYITMSCKPQRFLKVGEKALPQITGTGTPMNIQVAEGAANEIFDSAFIAAVSAATVGNRVMTVLDTDAYDGAGNKLILHYSDDRLTDSTWIIGGDSSTNPTTGNGGTVSYGGMAAPYNNVISVNITDKYTFFETPMYYEIVDSNNDLIGSVYPTTMTINNPTKYPARPLIRFHYSQALNVQPVCLINQASITLTANTSVLVAPLKTVTIEDIYLDCDTMDAYAPLTGYSKPYNCNGGVYAPLDVVLEPGENIIRYNDTVDYIEIIPNWWTL